MFKEILTATKLEPAFCAELLGVSQEQFAGWLRGSTPIPDFVVPELCAVLGIREKELSSRPFLRGATESMLAPAIWYKLRDVRLQSADRELVAVVRKLGRYLSQLQSIHGPVMRFDPLFRSVRERVDKAAPPAIQGRDAARAFRGASGLGQGQVGIGEVLRSFLRSHGILVIESPLTMSSVEGCSFRVGDEDSPTPTLFANTHGSTWFRRNAVLVHELGHAIFDLESEQVAVDYKGESTSDLSESRAHAFAQECLVPRSVLVHFGNRFGLKWEELGERELARLVAETHTEQRFLLKAALEAELIDEQQYDSYSRADSSALVREFSTHALSTQEYIETLPSGESKWWLAQNRNVTIGARTVRLPSGYVTQVAEAFNAGEISLGKAAEMLLMDREAVRERFGEILTAAA